MNANNLYGLTMSQEIPNEDFEWVSDYECRNIRLLLNYANSCIAIFDTWLFDLWENKEIKKSFIFKLNLEYLPELHERDDHYSLAPEVMIISPEITWKQQHNLPAKYFRAACP